MFKTYLKEAITLMVILVTITSVKGCKINEAKQHLIDNIINWCSIKQYHNRDNDFQLYCKTKVASAISCYQDDDVVNGLSPFSIIPLTVSFMFFFMSILLNS